MDRGDDNKDTDWRLAAERIGAAVQAIAPRMLVFVEGVQAQCSPVPLQQLACWGGALDSAGKAPVRLRVPNKLVYSPHVYGPGAAPSASFKTDCHGMSFNLQMPHWYVAVTVSYAASCCIILHLSEAGSWPQMEVLQAVVASISMNVRSTCHKSMNALSVSLT